MSELSTKVALALLSIVHHDKPNKFNSTILNQKTFQISQWKSPLHFLNSFSTTSSSSSLLHFLAYKTMQANYLHNEGFRSPFKLIPRAATAVEQDKWCLVGESKLSSCHKDNNCKASVVYFGSTEQELQVDN